MNKEEFEIELKGIGPLLVNKEQRETVDVRKTTPSEVTIVFEKEFFLHSNDLKDTSGPGQLKAHKLMCKKFLFIFTFHYSLANSMTNIESK